MGLLNRALLLICVGIIVSIISPIQLGTQTNLLLVILAGAMRRDWRLNMMTFALAGCFSTAVVNGYLERREQLLSRQQVSICEVLSSQQSTYGFRTEARTCALRAVVRLYTKHPIDSLTDGSGALVVALKERVYQRNSFGRDASVEHIRSAVVANARLLFKGQSAQQVRLQDWQNPPRHQGLMRALVLGDTTGVSDQQWALLRESQTLHLFVVSGLHVSALCILIQAVISLPMRLTSLSLTSQQAITFAIMALLLASYLIYASAGLAVIRASMMTSLALVARAVGIRLWCYQGLLFFCVIYSVIAPLDVFSVGYWLSVCAVTLLLSINWRSPASIVVTQCALTLLSAAILQQPFNWLAIVTNLIAIPLTSFVVLPTSAMALTFESHYLLSELANMALDALLLLIARMSEFSAVGVSIELIDIVLLALAYLAYHCQLRAFSSLCLLGLLSQSIVNRESVGLYQLDVGQGSAYQLKDGEYSLVYDAGAGAEFFSMGERWVVPALRGRLSTGSQIVVIASHQDNDHNGGIAAIKRYLSLHNILGGELLSCPAGTAWRWHELSFYWLSAVADQQSNNGSCVLLVEGFDSKLLLTGDIEREAEYRLVSTGVPGVDVLSVPHHGSKTSSSFHLLQTTLPSQAIMSRGRQNRYRHPHKSVVERYERMAIELFDSGTQGEIKIDLEKQEVYPVTKNSYWWQWRLNQTSLKDKVKE